MVIEPMSTREEIQALWNLLRECLQELQTIQREFPRLHNPSDLVERAMVALGRE
jgi:hypothetical protein